MDSAATFISLFRCGDASCSWGQRRVSELIYVCCLAFFSSDNVYIASFWGSQGTQLNCMLYIKCRPVNILRLYLFIYLFIEHQDRRLYTAVFLDYLCGIHLLCTSVGTEELQDLESLQSLQLTKRTVRTSSYTKCSQQQVSLHLSQ